MDLTAPAGLGDLTGGMLTLLLMMALLAGWIDAVNLATNTGALLLFSLAGTVQWRLGLFMGGMNMLGGHLGARTAT